LDELEAQIATFKTTARRSRRALELVRTMIEDFNAVVQYMREMFPVAQLTMPNVNAAKISATNKLKRSHSRNRKIHGKGKQHVK
jgi:hypothetical protein